jgi:putative ABC transport system ATP-binding protein
MSSISCIDLCKYYQQGDAVIKGLDHVNLEIEQGSFICLSGPSGSGKTTLLNCIGGLDSLDSGEISIDGERVDLLGKAALADLRLFRIGFVFQAYNLIPVLSARENVEFVMQVQGVTAAERHQRSSRILHEVGLEGMEERRPAQLSGGQQQRVAVARAIVSQPKLVLADEPTANLDSVSMEKLMEHFRELNRVHKVTFLIATHDQRVMEWAERRISMEDGRVVMDKTQKAR